MARNYLLANGIRTVRHAVFRLPIGRIVSDLYHPPSKTAYEVKTGQNAAKKYLQTRLRLYGLLLSERLANRVVYVHIRFGGSTGFSKEQTEAIHEWGFETLDVEGLPDSVL